MSNIPFNTISSMLGAPAVARQLASAQDKKVQEQIRGQRQLAQVSQAEHEEVDDPGGHEIQHVHDEERKPKEEKKKSKRQGEEQVDIEGIEVESAARLESPSISHLDISA